MLDFSRNPGFCFPVLRKGIAYHGLRALFSLLPVLLLSWGSTSQAAPGEAGVVIESVEGIVEVEEGNQPGAGAATNGTAPTLPCVIRTKEQGRFTLRVGAATLIRGGSETEAEFVPSTNGVTTVKVNRGRLYFFHRDKAGRFQVETRAARITVIGTSFSIVMGLNGAVTTDLFDGQVEVANSSGSLSLTNRAAARAEIGKPPERTAVIEMARVLQWNLYYPAIVDPDELALEASASTAIAESLAEYRTGNLLAASKNYPKQRQPASRAEAAYYAGLLMATGETEAALNLIKSSYPPIMGEPTARLDGVERGLRQLIEVVAGGSQLGLAVPQSAAEWLAYSYDYQSQGKLTDALKAAKAAVQLNPRFSFAQARLAELEFSFGSTVATARALDEALKLSPENAQALTVRGFVQAARGSYREAEESFAEAARIDPALGNGWLGRGLCRIHAGDRAKGLQNLQHAATVEPTRAILRSYLAKAYADGYDTAHATNEFALAKQYDPKDPTAWLYSALFLRQQNRFNEGIEDLEKSTALNTNRAIYRSRLLLDQDRAVRSANLASIYRDAGLGEAGLREASRAVASDYANYSAHLFLADSYTALSDPSLVSLRYETATFSEYLLANLLSPGGANTLSRTISEQEYSRMFDRNRLGVGSRTTYLSNGDWQQEVSQYGNYNGSSYGFDGVYRSFDGWRPNNDLEQQVYSAQFKQQLTAEDSVYFQAIWNDLESGDRRQYYNPTNASNGLRIAEKQSPNFFAGLHHEWSPQSHTLLLVGRLEDRLSLSEPDTFVTTFDEGSGDVIQSKFGLNYENDFAAYSSEVQQIWQASRHTFIAGARFQTGETEVTSSQSGGDTNFFLPLFASNYVQRVSADLGRLSCYIYDNWQVADNLLLSAGLAYDWLKFPKNVNASPITAGEREDTQISPKAGFIWTPARSTSVRGAYTRSLGGTFFDQSVRLEPTQMAGFNQAFRSLFPESLVGTVPGSQFEGFHLALDHKFQTRTYLTLESAVLMSSATRSVGVFNFDGTIPAQPAQRTEALDYEERSIACAINQLIGKRWSVGARYRLTDSRLEVASPDPAAAGEQRATLQQLSFFGAFNHASGFFARGEALWWSQANRGYSPALPGDDFWQFNIFGGYRFPRNHGELSVGVANLADEDYRLNPVNPHSELPRSRTLVVRFSLDF